MVSCIFHVLGCMYLSLQHSGVQQVSLPPQWQRGLFSAGTGTCKRVVERMSAVVNVLLANQTGDDCSRKRRHYPAVSCNTVATLLSTGFSWLASDWKLTKELCIFNVIQKDALLCNLLSILTVYLHSLLCVGVTSRRGR